MTNFDPTRLTRAETYGRLREWAERLKKFEGVPDMYRDIPSYPESLRKEYTEAQGTFASDEARAAFLDRHLDYLDNVRRQVQLKDPGYLKTQELIAKNYANYPGGAFSVGIDPAKEMQFFANQIEGNVTPFSHGLLRPAHELYGHLRPSLFGIQPANTPVTVPGLPGTYKPSLIAPTNESLAHSLNNVLIRNLGISPETIEADPKLRDIQRSLSGEKFPHFSTAIGGRIRGLLSDPEQVEDLAVAARALEQTPEISPYLREGPRGLRRYANEPQLSELVKAHPRLPEIMAALRGSNYLSQQDFLSPLEIPRSARQSIARNLLNKYVNPSLRNFQEGLRISTPGFERYTDSSGAVPRGVDPLDEKSSLVADKLATLTEFDLPKSYSSLGMMIFGADPVGAAARGLAQGIRSNPAGAAGGAAMTLLNDEVAKALAKDDYRAAATEAAKDIALGAAAETGLRQVAAPIAQRVAPAAAARVAPYVAGAARVGIPAAVGAGLFMQGRTGSALNTLTNKAAEVVPGLRANPQTDVGRRAGRAIANEGQYILNSILRNRIPYFKGRLF